MNRKNLLRSATLIPILIPAVPAMAAVNLTMSTNSATVASGESFSFILNLVSTDIATSDEVTGLDYYLQGSTSGIFKMTTRDTSVSPFGLPDASDAAVVATPGGPGLTTSTGSGFRNGLDLGAVLTNVSDPPISNATALVASITILVSPATPAGVYTISPFIPANLGYSDAQFNERPFTSVGSISVTVAGTEQWTNGAGTSSWNNLGNWSLNTIVNGRGTAATFNLAAGGSVTLDAAQTVGKLNFNNGSFTIAAGSGGNLTIDDTGDSTISPQINVTSGSQAISAPITLNNGLAVTLTNNAKLTVSNTITATNAGIISAGGAGTFTIGAGGVLPSVDSLSIGTGAKVALAIGASATTQTIAGLSIDTTTASKLDLGNNILNIKYSGASPAATIAAEIISGRASGAWNGTGIDSSAVVDLHHGVGYKDNGTNNVEVRYTLLGDTDLSGSINFTDLLTLAQHYGQSGQSWSTGDTDYNGSINFTDLLNLAQNYGQNIPAGSSEFSPAFAADWNLALSEAATVPEPAALGLVGVGLLASLGRRRRRANRSED